MLVAFGLMPAPAAAQDPVLDSLDILFDSLTAVLLDAGPRHTIRLRPIHRRYTVGGTRLSENAVGLEYALREADFRVAVRTAGPVRFTSGRTRIDAMTPVEATIDVRLGEGDSLRLALSSASSPGSLGGAEFAALAGVGTSTVDLESIGLGTPPVAGASIVLSRPLAGFRASLRLGAEVEPRPDVPDSVYWRGATVRAGVGIGRRLGPVDVETGVEVAHSYADSLDGRNAFQGGGHLLARLDVEAALGALAQIVGFGSAYYYAPFGVDRIVATPRLAAVGRVHGGWLGFLLPAGNVSILPMLGAARESAHDDTETARAAFSARGSSWSVSASTSAAIPLGRLFQIIPEAGWVHGAVSGEFFAVPTGDIRPIGFTYADGLSGWYAALELSVAF